MFAIRSLVEELMPDWPSLDVNERHIVARDLCNFVAVELTLAPFQVRFGVAILGVFFFVVAWLLSGRQGSTHQGTVRRREVIERWSGLGTVFGQFIRLHRSLVVLAFYEHPVVRRNIGLTDIERVRESYVELRTKIQAGDV